MKQLMFWLRRYRYECVAVGDGMLIMMLELVGSRYVAPELGTSTYVWTAIIGVILGALAVGNYLGGRLADRDANPRFLVIIFMVAAVVLLAILLVQSTFISFIGSLSLDLRLSAFVVSLLLFAPPALFMGMVSPYLAKLRLTSLNTAGQSVGRLYAANTAGSIIGTFLTGYVLIGAVGSRTLGFIVVAGLILVSFGVVRHGMVVARLVLLVIIVLLGFVAPRTAVSKGYTMLYDGDSSYARYQVVRQKSSTEDVRYLLMDAGGIQSATDVRHPNNALFSYPVQFVQAALVKPEPPRRILMIGGGALTIPTLLHRNFPEAHIDVVEIDPKLTDIASQYFGYEPSPNITIINQDGRYYLNHATATYDIVYVDAFSSQSPPFQLTTSQTAKLIKQRLSPNGVAVINLVGHLGGPNQGFVTSELNTFRSQFSSVGWYQSNPGTDLQLRQNSIVVAANNGSAIQAIDTKAAWAKITLPAYDKQLVLTDDFAPVERLTAD